MLRFLMTFLVSPAGECKELSAPSSTATICVASHSSQCSFSLLCAAGKCKELECPFKHSLADVKEYLTHYNVLCVVSHSFMPPLTHLSCRRVQGAECPLKHSLDDMKECLTHNRCRLSLFWMLISSFCPALSCRRVQGAGEPLQSKAWMT
jgi:hypothetical protein